MLCERAKSAISENVEDQITLNNNQNGEEQGNEGTKVQGKAAKTCSDTILGFRLHENERKKEGKLREFYIMKS